MSDPYSDAIDEVMEEARQKLCDLMAEIKRGELVREGDNKKPTVKEITIHMPRFEKIVGRSPTTHEHNVWLQIEAGLEALFPDEKRREEWWGTRNAELKGFAPADYILTHEYGLRAVLHAVNRARGIG